MSSTTPQRALAQANAMKIRFESAYSSAAEEGVDLTKVGWENFSDHMLASFAVGSISRHLASYALIDAKLLIKAIQKGIPEDMTVQERLELLHKNADRIVEPAATMTDGGKQRFMDGITPEDVMYIPARVMGSEDYLAWYGFDFDYYTSPHSGCPARHMKASDKLPASVPQESGEREPDNFLRQFFHLAIDVAFNDPDFS